LLPSNYYNKKKLNIPRFFVGRSKYVLAKKFIRKLYKKAGCHSRFCGNGMGYGFLSTPVFIQPILRFFM